MRQKQELVPVHRRRELDGVALESRVPEAEDEVTVRRGLVSESPV